MNPHTAGGRYSYLRDIPLDLSLLHVQGAPNKPEPSPLGTLRESVDAFRNNLLILHQRSSYYSTARYSHTFLSSFVILTDVFNILQALAARP